MKREPRYPERNLSFGKKYLTTMPLTIPDGKVLVHNQVFPVSKRPGTRGSRIWTQDWSDEAKLVVCDCEWASELGAHYRVFGTVLEDEVKDKD
jgi:hypothetical protein